MTKMAARKQQVVEMSSEDESSLPVSGGDLRRGPWTVEEDLLLVNYIAAHGEGRWNALARSAGLKRTGKSCRLRWLNYLRPDLRRGNMTAQEQLLILELHARWGNRWSKIAQHLPGRTDNEIKNYWRTRVQKHARQLNCDVDSQQFKDLMRYLWMPRLLERIHSSSSSSEAVDEISSCTTAAASSSSVSTTTDNGVQQQQPLAVVATPTPVMVANSNADYFWSSAVCQQPPQYSTTTSDHGYYAPAPPVHQFAAETTATTCWSDDISTGGAVYDADMADLLGDTTMWGADDLWYTQLMGL